MQTIKKAKGYKHSRIIKILKTLEILIYMDT